MMGYIIAFVLGCMCGVPLGMVVLGIIASAAAADRTVREL